jgi:hypothetical protein
MSSLTSTRSRLARPRRAAAQASRRVAGSTTRRGAVLPSSHPSPLSLFPFHTDEISTAVSLLANNRRITESKDHPTGVRVDYDATALVAAKSLFRGGAVYRFLAVQTGTLTSSGAGLILTTIPNNLASFAEGSSLAALFDECRSRRVKCHVVPGVFSGATPNACIIGYNNIVRGTSDPPGSTSLVTRLEGSKLVCFQSGSTASPGYVTFYSPPRALAHPYCDTGTQYTQSPPSGTLGGFWVANVNTLALTTLFCTYKIECEIELRMRA